MRLSLLLLVAACNGGGGPGDLGVEDLGDLAMPPPVDLAWVPPVVPAACAAPTVTLGGEAAARGSDQVVSPRLAWNGGAPVLVWADVTSGGSFTVWLQHLGATGLLAGGPTLVGSGTGAAPAVTVASDGTHVVVAWEQGGNVDVVLAGSGLAPLTAAGARPSLAFGAGGFVLAYRDAALGVVLRAVDTTPALHDPISVAASTTASPRLTTTATGYALAYAATASWTLARYGPDLSPGAATTITGADGVALVAIGGSGEQVAAVWQETATQISAAVYDASGTGSARVAINGTSPSLSGPVAVAGGAMSFAAAWSDGGNFAGYNTLDATGTAGSAVQAVSTFHDNDDLDIIAVSDGFLVAVAVDPTLDRIQLAHLACP